MISEQYCFLVGLHWYLLHHMMTRESFHGNHPLLASGWVDAFLLPGRSWSSNILTLRETCHPVACWGVFGLLGCCANCHHLHSVKRLFVGKIGVWRGRDLSTVSCICRCRATFIPPLTYLPDLKPYQHLASFHQQPEHLKEVNRKCFLLTSFEFKYYSCRNTWKNSYLGFLYLQGRVVEARMQPLQILGHTYSCILFSFFSSL